MTRNRSCAVLVMLLAVTACGCGGEEAPGLVTGEYAFSYVPLIVEFSDGSLRLEMDRTGHAIGHSYNLLRCDGDVMVAPRDELTTALNAGRVLELQDRDRASCRGISDTTTFRMCVETDLLEHCFQACDDGSLLRTNIAMQEILTQLADERACGPDRYPFPPG